MWLGRGPHCSGVAGAGTWDRPAGQLSRGGAGRPRNRGTCGLNSLGGVLSDHPWVELPHLWVCRVGVWQPKVTAGGDSESLAGLVAQESWALWSFRAQDCDVQIRIVLPVSGPDLNALASPRTACNCFLGRQIQAFHSFSTSFGRTFPPFSLVTHSSLESLKSGLVAFRSPRGW